MKTTFIFCAMLLFILVGCDRQKEKTFASEVKQTEATLTLSGEQKNPAIAPAPLLTKTAPINIVEMPSDALPIWRLHREQRPTLVILSTDPMLMTISPQVREEVTDLVEQGKPGEFLKWGRTQTVNPLLLPEQTLTVALQNNFFGGIVWVLPPPANDQEISPEDFRKKLISNGILTKSEAANLSFANGIFTGTLQGRPFQASATGQLPQITGPVIVHLDFNFFTFQYRNEVTTPIYSLLHGTLVVLRKTGWQPLAVTLNIDSEEGETPLDLRFLKELFVEVFNNPQLLDENLSETWELHKEARHLETFFQPETMINHYLRREELLPLSASAKYDIYRVLYVLKDREEALSYLDKAIKLDRGYAREYLELASTASTKAQYREALSYLKKAQKLLPDNPFIRMETINILLQLGMQSDAKELLREVQSLPWSKVYYPNIDTTLKELEDRLVKNKEERR